MKRLGELTVEELTANPVWRYEGGSGAEALVAPVKRDSLSQSDDEIFLAATDFQLSDSSRHFGFCFPADDSGIDYLQPVIVSASRHVCFWFEGTIPPDALENQWSALEKQPADIFPVSFHCRVPVDGRAVAGQIKGVESSETLASGPAPAIASARATGRVPTARPVQARRDTGAVEKRTARRRKAEMTVEFVQDSFRGTGVIADLSRRGMFVRSNRIPPRDGPRRPADRGSPESHENRPDGKSHPDRGRSLATGAFRVRAAPRRGIAGVRGAAFEAAQQATVIVASASLRICALRARRRAARVCARPLA